MMRKFFFTLCFVFFNVVYANNPPVITSTPITVVDEDTYYDYTLEAVDPDNDELNWSITQGSTLPLWLVLKNSEWVTTLAGSDYGDSDGVGSEAQFRYPYGIAVDSNGFIYVADTYNYKIKKITPDGNVTTFAGSGSAGNSDGVGTDATFNYPYSVAVDKYDNVYVADTYNNLIRKITPDGNVTTIAGNGNAGYVDADAANASFDEPQSLAVDSEGNIYVADTGNNVIRKITPDGNVTTFAGSGNAGYVDGVGVNASFDYPAGIAVDDNFNVYVADRNNNVIRKITPDGNVTTLAGSGNMAYVNGVGTEASFSYPYGVVTDKDGNVYVADQKNHLIRKITPDGNVSTVAGFGWYGLKDGEAIYAYFTYPSDVCIDKSGNIYVADTGNHVIRKVFVKTRLIGTPTNDDVGVYDINLSVSDGYNTVYQNFKLTVNNVNDAPTASDVSFNITDGNLTFTPEDFNYSDVDVGDSLEAIFITSLPQKGKLMLGSDEVVIDEKIPVDQIQNLIYIPEMDNNAVVFDSFEFKVNDGEANSSSYTAYINDTPVIKSVPVTTVYQDETYFYTLTGEDVYGNTLTWGTADGTSLPSWLSFTNTSADFHPVGMSGFSKGIVNYVSFASDDNLTLYVAFQDGANENRASVMKFNGTEWVTVGNEGFSDGTAYYVSMAINSKGVVYVVYEDAANDFKATVMKFDGSKWVSVGDKGFSAGYAYFTSIVFDQNDTPYITYQDAANGYKATVMKFDGTNWVYVGAAGLSDGYAYYESIAFDSNSTPYIAYQDTVNGYKATVKKFNGSEWVYVGDGNVSTGYVQYISLVIKNDIPFVLYQDTDNDFKATVMKFDGSKWVSVGDKGFSRGSIDYPAMAVDKNGNPYVIFTDWSVGGAATVMKFNGSDWIKIGSEGFSEGAAFYNTIILSSQGYPYVAYKDSANDNKITVMKYIPAELTGTPTNDDVGVYDINLTLSDGGLSTTQNFTITVVNVNDAPSASDVEFTIDEDSNLTFNVTDFNYSDIDSDPLAAIIVTKLPQKGKLTLNGKEIEENESIAADELKDLIYTPGANEYGNAYDFFKFMVNDGELNSSEYTASINVISVDDPPVFAPIIVPQSVEDAGDFNISFSATDIEGDPITYSAESLEPDIATVTLSDGVLTIHQMPNANGVVSIEINATSDGLTTTKEFNITILGVNDAPSASDVEFTIDEDSNLTFNVTDFNYSDIDSDPLAAIIVTKLPQKGKLTLNGKEVEENESIAADELKDLIYTPGANEYGNAYDFFKFMVNDGELNSSEYTATINVNPVNDAPSSENVVFDIRENSEKNFTANDFVFNDPDLNDTLKSLLITKLPDRGYLMLNDGTMVEENQSVNVSDLVFKPKSDDYASPYTVFWFKVSDGKLYSEMEYNATINVYSSEIENIVTNEGDENVSHIVNFADHSLRAVSEINGSFVELIDDGVKTTYQDNNVTIEVIGTKDDTTTQSINTLDGTLSLMAVIDYPGEKDSVIEEVNGSKQAQTTLKVQTSTVRIITDTKGQISHVVQTQSETTEVISTVKNSQTVVTQEGEIETTAIQSQSGYYIKAVATTTADGKSTTKFVKVSVSDPNDITPLSDTLIKSDMFDAGNRIVIGDDNESKLYIKVNTPITKPITIE